MREFLAPAPELEGQSNSDLIALLQHPRKGNKDYFVTALAELIRRSVNNPELSNEIVEALNRLAPHSPSLFGIPVAWYALGILISFAHPVAIQTARDVWKTWVLQGLDDPTWFLESQEIPVSLLWDPSVPPTGVHSPDAFLADFFSRASSFAPHLGDQPRGERLEQLVYQLFHQHIDLNELTGLRTHEWVTQLPELCSGHWEHRPRVAFLGEAPPFIPDEDAPNQHASLDQWLNYYRGRLDRRHDGKIFWWHRDGRPGGPIRTLNFCEGILQRALGRDRLLGRDAVVTNALPYKVPTELRSKLLGALGYYLPQTLQLLKEIGTEVVITVGHKAAVALAKQAGWSTTPRLTDIMAKPSSVEIGAYRFIWIASAHPMSGVPMLEERVAAALAAVQGR